MHVRRFGIALLLGIIFMTHRVEASPLDGYKWKNRVLVVVGAATDAAVQQQRQIYESSKTGMVERQIILAEALDDSERSRQIRNRVSADGRRFHAFLIGKDGNVAIAADKPLPADDLFRRVDAMPMRQDEMRRAR